MRFILRLRKVLQNFDLQEAIMLSDAIHDAEEHGYELTRHEERLWQQLTDKIERQRC